LRLGGCGRRSRARRCRGARDWGRFSLLGQRGLNAGSGLRCARASDADEEDNESAVQSTLRDTHAFPLKSVSLRILGRCGSVISGLLNGLEMELPVRELMLLPVTTFTRLVWRIPAKKGQRRPRVRRAFAWLTARDGKPSNPSNRGRGLIFGYVD